MDSKQFEILLSMHKDLATMNADIAEMKADLREHMRRTNIIETELKWLHRQVWIAHGAIALVAFAAGFVRFFL